MNCGCGDKNRIIIVRGNDTNFNGQNFVHFNITSNAWDLSTMKAAISLGGITKTFTDLSNGIDLSYTASETASMPFGDIDGVLKVYNQEEQIVTIESLLPFKVISIVHGDAIAITPAEFNIEVKQGGETVMNIDIEAGVTVSVVPEIEMLPVGSDATVTNEGTLNHLLLKFHIPESDSIESIEKTSTEGLIDTYTITWATGRTSTFQIENGNGISSIEKTSAEDLVDTYTIYYTNGNSTTFTVTNGKDATINGVNTLTLTATDGLTLSQSDDAATISGNTLQQGIADINALIPEQASADNKLADKNFVNSTVATNTANFIGTFNSVEELEAYSGTLTNNDYAFVVSEDEQGNTVYDRYKYTTSTDPASWEFEYELNNSSFTANQWAAINSGATQENIAQITTNKNAIGTLASLTTTDKSSVVGAVNELNNNKQATITGGASTITTSNLKTNRALISNANGKVDVSPVTNTELSYLSGATSNIQTQINNANTELDTKIDKGYAVNDFATNCITEIPQDVNISLASDGTLTVKSGTKLYVPNGSDVDVYQTTADATRTIASAGTYVVCFYKNTIPWSGTPSIVHIYLNRFTSGSTDSLAGTTYHAWYDTTNNVIKRYADDTSNPAGYCCYPICIVTATAQKIVSIDKVFNGAGYCGHHAFVLPGVSALLSKGFNADGTLSNLQVKTTALGIQEMSTQSSRFIGFQGSNNIGSFPYTEIETTSELRQEFLYQYVRETNSVWLWQNNAWSSDTRRCPLVDYNYNGTTVTKFDIRPVSGLSSNYINTALGYEPERAEKPLNTLATSGTISPLTNTHNYIAPTGAVTLSLPASPTATIVNEIELQVNQTSAVGFNFGSVVWGDEGTPDMSVGLWDFIFTYIGGNWCASYKKWESS